MDRSRTRGFTLMELMVVLALASVMVALAVPSMRQFARNNRLTTGANDMLHAFSLARTEALKRQSGRVTVCATTDPNAGVATLTCSYGAMSGWIVFVDANNNGQFDRATDEVLARGSANSAVTVKNDHDGIVCFNQTGFQPVDCGGQAPLQHVVLCDHEWGTEALGTDSRARTVIVTPTGRARVSRLQADVSVSLTAIGESCP
ncbi:MAG: GspH/FimT family pseudopilin [Steroidobacteraceae bacterium]